MPTYEYECTECGAVVDIFQPITERARRRLKKTDPRPCACDAPVARRIGTGAGIIFKGSGFHQTDYRSESYKQAAKADKESSDGKAKKSGDSKAESKAGAKSGTKANKKETKSTGAGN